MFTRLLVDLLALWGAVSVLGYLLYRIERWSSHD